MGKRRRGRGLGKKDYTRLDLGRLLRLLRMGGSLTADGRWTAPPPAPSACEHQLSLYRARYPAVPPRLFRRSLRRGYISESNGRYRLTASGEQKALETRR